MASDIDTTDLRELALAMRKAPKAVRDAVKAQVRPRVAEPMAGKIKAAASGPYAGILAGGVRTRASADATIAVGGARPKGRGGAGPQKLVFGTEFGGGKRTTAVPRSGKHRGYRRHTTRQFANNKRPFVFKTFEANEDAITQAYAEIVMEVLDEEVL